MAIQIVLGLLTIIGAIDCVSVPMRVARMESRDRETIGQLSTTIMVFPITAAFTALSFTDYIPQWHFPWIFLAGFLTISFVLNLALQAVIDGEPAGILKFVLIAISSALLTAGQIALAEYFDTWLILVVRSIPIPVLGLTVALSALTSVYCFLVTIYGALFHALRLAYSVK